MSDIENKGKKTEMEGLYSVVVGTPELGRGQISFFRKTKSQNFEIRYWKEKRDIERERESQRGRESERERESEGGSQRERVRERESERERVRERE
eukprot:340851-Amorphochlora_amoeboformis.AAC.1